MKRLYRSNNDRKIAGVCGGIGEYFNIDSTIIRLAWIFLTIFSWILGGLIIYFIACLIMPEH